MMVLLYFELQTASGFFGSGFSFLGRVLSPKTVRMCESESVVVPLIAICSLRYQFDASCHISALRRRFSRYLQ